MRVVEELKNVALTALLFTWSDIKTILLPVTTSAVAIALTFSYHSIFYALLWTWVHLLQANISNQCDSRSEDILNKPWRPLPSNRITVSQAKTLRWLVVGLCQLASIFFGVTFASSLLTAATILHDDLNLSKHWLGKTACNSLGYFSFELGATQIVGGTVQLTQRCTAALVSSAAIIFLTIHAQDFADVVGDMKSGRITLPIAYPRASRVYILAAVPICSVLLSLYWAPTTYITAVLVGLGLAVGARYYWFREATDDARTYVLYNLWLVSIHLIPALLNP